MKTWKKLLAALLTVAMICVLAACVQPETPAGNTATVTFMNGSEVYETATVEIGAKLTLPKAPKGEKGKGLVGWTTIDGDVEEVIAPETFVVEADITLYALWADVYTVVINADNGTAFDVKEVFAGTVLEQPADPIKEGFKFVEWRDALAETPFDWTQPIHADVTIKAMYGDGAPNRVSDTKWDFTLGHGSWVGSQGGWNYLDPKTNLPVKDMVYTTTEDGYAAWGFTKTDNLDNIPVVNGENGEGYGMKYIYNEGISIEASKAKLVVMYIKPKYFPIDMYGKLNDQFRISVLTSNGGMIYGYSTNHKAETWAIHSAAYNQEMVRADIMEDGWICVQFKIHELDVWSEDAIIKGMAISIVQRPGTPVMDIISVKSIELLDQEGFIVHRDCEANGHLWKDATCQTPKTCSACGVTEGDLADHSYVDGTCSVCGLPQVILNAWDLSDAAQAADWSVYCNKKENYELTMAVTSAGMEVLFKHENNWRAIVLKKTTLDINKLTGKLTFTYSTEMTMKEYRIHLLTDLGGKLDANGTSGKDYICVQIADILAGTVAGWAQTTNDDGSVTVTADMTKFSDFVDGTELKGLTICTVPSSKVANTTIIYKSVELEKIPEGHNCETDGHILKDATCTTAKTCSVCGATEGEANGHSWKDATCTAAKTCSVCKATEGEANGHSWTDATCTVAKTCSVCGATEGEANGHSWNDATCKAPKTCSVCGTTEGELGGHTDTDSDLKCDLCSANLCTDHNWNDATCKVPKTCSICGATEGELADHSWNNATCTAPKTCGVCGITEGENLAHTDANKDHLCDVCTSNMVVWYMNTTEDASDWYCAQAYTEVRPSRTYSELTDAGFKVNYGHKNAWKGIIMKDVEIDITELSGLLSFTYYNENMDITNYRVYVLTDKGGDLMANDKLLPNTNYYAAVAIGDIAGNDAWTRTENADGSITVTFDLTTLPFFAEGTVLKGMDIVTVDETVTGEWFSMTYSSIEIR